jgi:hypothetical protein
LQAAQRGLTKGPENGLRTPCREHSSALVNHARMSMPLGGEHTKIIAASK